MDQTGQLLGVVLLGVVRVAEKNRTASLASANKGTIRARIVPGA